MASGGLFQLAAGGGGPLPMFGELRGELGCFRCGGGELLLLEDAVAVEPGVDGVLMRELFFEFGKLLLAGANLAAAREQAGGGLARADDQRAVGGQEFAVAGDEGEPAAGGLREPQRGGQPVDEPSSGRAGVRRAARTPAQFRRSGRRGPSRRAPGRDRRWRTSSPRRGPLSSRRKPTRPVTPSGLSLSQSNSRPGGGDDDELRELAERNVDQRRRVDVDVEQIGDDAANVAVGAVRFAVGPQRALRGRPS